MEMKKELESLIDMKIEEEKKAYSLDKQGLMNVGLLFLGAGVSLSYLPYSKVFMVGGAGMFSYAYLLNEEFSDKYIAKRKKELRKKYLMKKGKRLRKLWDKGSFSNI